MLLFDGDSVVSLVVVLVSLHSGAPFSGKFFDETLHWPGMRIPRTTIWVWPKHQYYSTIVNTMGF